ncbi:MAG: CarD family transcriptional regulator [Acidimicrobiales bacterium]
MPPEKLTGAAGVKGRSGPGPLAALLARLGDVPALSDVIGRSNAVLAVPRPAQAYVLAGLTGVSTRRPLLVVTATTADAERLAGDVACFLGGSGTVAGGASGTVAGAYSDPVVVLPAWETLPFERVSPEVATMGRRQAVLWHLFGDRPNGAPPPPQVVVGSVRAVLQRLASGDAVASPEVVELGGLVDAGDLVARLVGAGYRREHQVEHRGEIAVRGGIVDVFPPTADQPVRIDLLGDVVDRLTAFDVADQRSVLPLESVYLFGCRELRPTPAVRARATELTTAEPWGRPHWERLAAGHQFDGMEAWLPWVAPDDGIVTDRLGPEAQVIVVEPRRVRDRAMELTDEEGALAASLAATWGASRGPEGFPRLSLPYDRLLARTAAATLAMAPVADGPGVAAVEVRGFEPVAGDASRLARQVTALVDAGYSVTLCSPTAGGADRLAAVLAEEGIGAPVADGPAAAGAARVTVVPLTTGFILPEARVALASEADVTGRRTPHRPPRPRARPTDGFFDDLAPGSFVVHRQHGVARYTGVSTRTVAGTVRDYLVLEYRGSDRLYLPVDQIAAVTPYSGGETPTLSKMGGAEWQRTRARARAAAGDVAHELVELYRRRLAVTGHAIPPD